MEVSGGSEAGFDDESKECPDAVGKCTAPGVEDLRRAALCDAEQAHEWHVTTAETAHRVDRLVCGGVRYALRQLDHLPPRLAVVIERLQDLVDGQAAIDRPCDLDYLTPRFTALNAWQGVPSEVGHRSKHGRRQPEVLGGTGARAVDGQHPPFGDNDEDRPSRRSVAQLEPGTRGAGLGRGHP